MARRSAAAYDEVRRPEPGVVILAYHRVGGGSGLTVDLDPELFTDQMAMLADRCNVVTLDDLASSMPTASREAPTIAVTFDDGTADFVDHALPALVEHAVPATYYIATDFIERQRPFPDNGSPMTWAALAEAASTGLVTVGSHTHTHTVMDKLSPSEADDELRRARQLLQDRLGIDASHFAYPKGVFGGTAVEEVVGRHHRSAVLVGGKPNQPGSADPLRLDRVPVQQDDGITYFEKKIDGGMRLEGALRTGVNRLRYARAGN